LGHAPVILERKLFIEMLYDTLPEREQRVLTGKCVSSVIQSRESVSVRCDDGTVYAGDILVAADGVRSLVRQVIHPQLSLAGPGTCHFPATFQCLFGMSPLPKAIPEGAMVESHDKGRHLHLLALQEQVCWFVYSRITPNAEKTESQGSDMEAMANVSRTSSVWESGKVTFGGLWDTRTDVGLVTLQEGVLPPEKWSQGRIVLLGDVAHKMTPDLAFGANCAMESAVALVNELLPLKGRRPATKTCEAALLRYSRRRHNRAMRCVKTSGMHTRLTDWGNWAWRLVNRWVLRHGWVRRFAVDREFTPISRAGEVLDFVEERNWKEGRVKWVNKGGKGP
jgi:2-polyprenyl-6-methoxyphenol hydroxylase-like FAD-dependent oxidoreductase